MKHQVFLDMNYVFILNAVLFCIWNYLQRYVQLFLMYIKLLFSVTKHFATVHNSDRRTVTVPAVPHSAHDF
jgi:hypothetical protein